MTYKPGFDVTLYAVS